MEKANISLSPCASFYQNIILLSSTVLTSETLGWFPGKAGHLPYNYTPLSFFQNISQNCVNHWSELGGRPDSEESLNFHYHVSLNVNFLTSPHYQEGKMAVLIKFCNLQSSYFPSPLPFPLLIWEHFIYIIACWTVLCES